MAFETEGKLIAVYPVVQRSETFKTREFVIETSEESNGRVFTGYIKFQCTQDRTAIPDKFVIGDKVKVHFNIRGSKWTKNGVDNYITNLDAWRVEHLQAAYQAADAVTNTTNTYQPAASDNDDLPF